MSDDQTAAKAWERLGVLITAGPTVEDIDPVRFISNRSTGRMGVALAAAAAARGASVLLVHGPLAVPIPALPKLVCLPVRSASEMYDAVMSRVGEVGVAIMSAAVADFTPARVASDKIKKTTGDGLVLELVRTRDILAAVGARDDKPFLVGFAAETTDLERNARAKLVRKGCDMVCANDVSEPGSGFAVDTNRVTIYTRGGDAMELARMDKREVAERILDIVAAELSLC